MKNLLNIIIEKNPEAQQYREEIERYLNNSGVDEIEFMPIKHALGIALDDRVIIDSSVLKYPFVRFLYVVFHELAHAYQFKKYGQTKKWLMYFNEQPIVESANFMKYIEDIADEFAIRKLREFQKVGLLSQNEVQSIRPNYKNVPLTYFIKFIETFRKIVQEKGITDHSQIKDLFYYYVKVGNVELFKLNSN